MNEASKSAAKLNKTQAELVARAAKAGGFYSIETGSGRGAKGGRICYGDRDRNALNKLVDAGLVRITNRMSGSYFTGNGNTVFGSVISFELTTTGGAA